MTQNTHKNISTNDFTAKDFFIGIVQHWLLILALIVIALAGTVLYLLNKNPQYTSTTRILLEDRRSELTNVSQVNSRGAQINLVDVSRSLSNELQYLKSLNLARDVNKVVNFKSIAEFNKATKGNETAMLKYFARKLKVGLVPDSNVIEISYTASKPDLAARMVKVITDVYKQQKATASSTENNNETRWLEEKVRDLQAKQRDMDAKIVDYRIQNGIFEGQNNQGLLSERLSALNRSIATASAQRAEVVARRDALNGLLTRNGNLNAAQNVLNSALIQQYRQQVLATQRQIVVLSETLLPSHPRLASLNAELTNINAQIRTEANNILLSLRNEAEISIRREDSIKAELDNIKASGASTLRQEVELNAIIREASANRALLDSYLAKSRESNLRNITNLSTSKVKIISPAIIPLRQSGINGTMMFSVMGVIALLLGIVIASIRTMSRLDKTNSTESFDNDPKGTKNQPINKYTSKPTNVFTLKAVNGKKNAAFAHHEPTGIISFADLSFMAAIPYINISNRQNNKQKNDILSHLDTEYADSFIDLTDNLIAQSGSGFQKHFMISGLENQDEPYETLLNLGRILDMKGAKTLIIDLDVQSQLFSKTTVDTANFGFSDIISGRCYFEDCIINDKKSDLEFLLAGSSIDILDNVITSTEMSEFLDELDQVYDVILVHSNDIKQKHITDFIDGQIDLTLLVADWQDRATKRLEESFLALKKHQGSDYGLLLTGADMNEFNKIAG